MVIDDHQLGAFSDGSTPSHPTSGVRDFNGSFARDRGFVAANRVTSFSYPFGFGATADPGGLFGFFTVQDYEFVFIPVISGSPFWNAASPDSPGGGPFTAVTQPDQVPGGYNCEVTFTGGTHTVNPWQLDGGVTAGWTNDTEGANAFFFEGGASARTQWQDEIAPGKYDITISGTFAGTGSGTITVYIVAFGTSVQIATINSGGNVWSPGTTFTIDSQALLGDFPFTILVVQSGMGGTWGGLTWSNDGQVTTHTGLPAYGVDWSVSTGNMAIDTLTNVPGFNGNISGVPH